MANDDEVIVHYCEHLISQRVCSMNGCDRIVRPDGSWRYSPPTVISREYIQWVISRQLASGEVEELGTADSYEAARQVVDVRCL
jgi:hypothetical protein